MLPQPSIATLPLPLIRRPLALSYWVILLGAVIDHPWSVHDRLPCDVMDLSLLILEIYNTPSMFCSKLVRSCRCLILRRQGKICL